MAQNPIEARPIGARRSWADEPAKAAPAEAPATLLAAASTETGKQTQTTETPAATATETPAAATTTTTEKPAEAAKPAAEAAKPAPVAPEKYDIKAPEGTEFDPKVLDAFTSAAKEADLSQDAAQKLIEKMAPALAARQADQVKAIHQEWTDTSTADKEFGGEKFKENLGVAKTALNMFDPIPAGATTTNLRTLLDSTGLGNHPEVIRLLYRAGKAISEDKFVGGNARSAGAVRPADVLYDKTQSKG